MQTKKQAYIYSEIIQKQAYIYSEIISKNATIWDFNVGIIWNYSELFISSQILGNT